MSESIDDSQINNRKGRKHNSVNISLRLELVKLFFEENPSGKNKRAFAQAHNINEQTLQNWIREYKSNKFDNLDLSAVKARNRPKRPSEVISIDIDRTDATEDSDKPTLIEEDEESGLPANVAKAIETITTYASSIKNSKILNSCKKLSSDLVNQSKKSRTDPEPSGTLDV